ncbi:hypothetical protein [Opitutus terrae]|uniref:hypothetical protein n=1 Tax=Opitutus terrae TaxID=107709 RepID=UPI001ED8C8E9|nr:hypothetical protein [Opitutus terrae]
MNYEAKSFCCRENGHHTQSQCSRHDYAFHAALILAIPARAAIAACVGARPPSAAWFARGLDHG